MDQPIYPSAGVMYGITHELDGRPRVRDVKLLKVGIGLPKGPAISTWIAPSKQWCVCIGYKPGAMKTTNFPDRAEAERFFNDNLAKAPTCPYPRKIGFFTFTRPVMQQDGSELFVPDWDAIEAHGSLPTEIDVVFLDDDPFHGAYQMWSSTELRCSGDGVNALRVVTLAATEEEKGIAADARAAGEKYFPVSRCWTNDCPFSKEPEPGKPSPCKPSGDLRFQLARRIRVGGTAYLHTNAIRSISQIFSSLYRVKALTGGRLTGIPMKMILRPYRTNHNGKAATQYGVSLDFRAEDIESLRRNLIEQAFEFHRLAVPPAKPNMIDAPLGTEDSIETDDAAGEPPADPDAAPVEA